MGRPKRTCAANRTLQISREVKSHPRGDGLTLAPRYFHWRAK